MQKKKSEKAIRFLETRIWVDCIKIFPIKKRVLVISSQYVNKQS